MVSHGARDVCVCNRVAVARQLRAQPPQVQFDVPSMIGCRDVTPAGFAEANRDERLLEAQFQITSLIRRGAEDDLIQYLYRIESPERSMQIADYLPKTTLATSVVGNLGVETQLEQGSSIGITAAGHYDQMVNAEATATASSKTASSVRYELLPRLELLAAAGTTSRGTGVYFKLKPSDAHVAGGRQGLCPGSAGAAHVARRLCARGVRGEEPPARCGAHPGQHRDVRCR